MEWMGDFWFAVLLYGQIFLVFLLIYIKDMIMERTLRQRAIEQNQRQQIITKQDRIQDVLVAMGLRETMEFRRASFRFSEIYSLRDWGWVS